MSRSFPNLVAVAVLSLSLSSAVSAQPSTPDADMPNSRTAATSDDDFFDWGWVGLLGLLGLAGLLPRRDRNYDRTRNSRSAD